MRKFNFVLALILAVGLFLPFNYPVQAATEVEAITGEGTFTDGFYAGVPGTWANLNSNDGATSRLDSNHPGLYTHRYHSYTANSFVTPYASIDSVTINYTAYGGPSTVNIQPFVYIGGNKYYGTDNAMVAAWTAYSYTWTTNPAGGNWTAATLNSAEWGVHTYLYTAGGWAPLTTYMSVTVTYTPSSAPIVTTQAVSSVTPTTATGNGNVTSDGGSAITERGTVYAIHAAPDTTDTKDTSAGTTGAFTTSIDTLTKGILYYVRAYAINAIGTSYGAEVSFTTINDSTISTIAASLLTSATARLNSQVTFDGAIASGEPCTVTFAYIISTSPHASYADCAAAPGVEVAVTVPSATYTTGQLPYLDIASLTAGATYYFAVKIENSTATPAYGAVLSFTAESGVSIPTNLTAIPTSTTVSYTWAKGVGAQYTLVRYSVSAYPATITDGSVGYLNTGNSFQLSGITAGTTIYASAWGKTGALYSGTGPDYTDGKIDVMATTLAYDSTSTTGSLVTPTPSSTWTQNPDATKVNTIPIFGAAVQNVAVAYNQPVNYLWYFIWILVAVGAAIAVYIRGQFNFVLALSTMIGIIGIGVFWYNLVAGLVVVVLAVIGIGWALVGFRRPGT